MAEAVRVESQIPGPPCSYFALSDLQDVAERQLRASLNAAIQALRGNDCTDICAAAFDLHKQRKLLAEADQVRADACNAKYGPENAVDVFGTYAELQLLCPVADYVRNWGAQCVQEYAATIGGRGSWPPVSDVYPASFQLLVQPLSISKDAFARDLAAECGS